MHAEHFISKRLRHKGGIAIASSAISFCVILIAVSVAAGFRSEIRNTLSSISGDIILANTPKDYSGSMGSPIEKGDSLITGLLELSGVASAQRAIYRSSIIQTPKGIQGAIVKGCDTPPSWVAEGFALENAAFPLMEVPLGEDSAQDFGEQEPLTRAFVPSTLAHRLEIQPEDTLKAFFIGESLAGAELIADTIYEDILGRSESQIIFTPLSTLQQINEWESSEYSAIELQLNALGREALDRITQQAGILSGLASSSVVQSNAQLFDWLNLIDYNVLAILALMIVVAGFNMVSSLLILLFQNISTIGILKSLGMSNRSIASVFVRVAARLAGLGLALGNASALLFCFVQSSTHLLKLDPVSYFVSYVPVKIDLVQILLTDAIAFVLILLFMLLPTLFISSIDPSRTVAQE